MAFLGGYAGSIPDPSDDAYYPKSMKLPWNEIDDEEEDYDDEEFDD